MAVLEVNGLCKSYPSFQLKDVSFQLDAGRIMGFIGRNGAGKTTTLKSILHIVHPDSGSIRFFSKPIEGNEQEIKSKIGFASGAVNYYPRRKICELIDVMKRFYPTWNDADYRHYMDLFSISEDKTPIQLSEGMKVKLNLALALSHKAELLILDEPTSGLDPVSREELLEVFKYLKEQGIAILFSTHITTDLEKCADDITYLVKGELIATESLKTFIDRYRAAGKGEDLESIMVDTEKESLYDKIAH